MYPTFYIRRAWVEEAAALSDLCFRSKAVWGYDAEFMALIRAALRVAREQIAAGDVWIATGTDGQIAGVVALAAGDAPGTLDLNKLFIEPRHMRAGVGRALLAHAVAEARRLTADDPRRPERSGLLRAQRRGANRRSAVGRGARPLAAALRDQARFHRVIDIRQNRPPRAERRVPRERRSLRLSTSRQPTRARHRGGVAWWHRR